MVKKAQRILAIDVLRGLTIALMILVNSPGSWSYIYAPLRHADWNGYTPTDMVFPFFMFIVGASMFFSLKKFNGKITKDATIKIIKRTVLIFIIGIVYTNLHVITDLGKYRIMGVLQRIGIAYGVAAFMCIALSKKNLGIISAAILLLYWGILELGGGNNPYGLEENIVRYVDVALFGKNHVWGGYGIPFDPEGLLSSLPSVVNITAGYLISYFLYKLDKAKAVKTFILWGMAGILVGHVWDLVMPINKALWTSSYVMLMNGYSTLLLGILIWIVDIKAYKSWTYPVVVYGTNPLFIYFLAGVFSHTMISFIQWQTAESSIISANQFIFDTYMVPSFGHYTGSLLYALFFVVFLWVIALVMHRRKIFIKI